MKTLFIAAAALGATFVAAIPATAQAQVNHRQWEQQRRIHHGARSGELTRRD